MILFAIGHSQMVFIYTSAVFSLNLIISYMTKYMNFHSSKFIITILLKYNLQGLIPITLVVRHLLIKTRIKFIIKERKMNHVNFLRIKKKS